MTIASLVVNLTANAARFHAEMEKAAGMTERVGKRIAKIGREISEAISLPILAAGFAAFHALLKESALHFGPLFRAFEGLKAATRDLFIALGHELEPVFLAIIGALRTGIAHVRAWIDAFHQLPQGVRQAVIYTLAFLAALGPTVLIAGKLIAAIGAMGKALTLLLTPTGLIAAAIIALAAAAIYAVTHWEQVKLRMVLVWTAIKEAVFDSISGVLGALASLTGWIPKLGDVVKDLKANFDAWSDQSLAKSAQRIQQLEDAVRRGTGAVQQQGVVTNAVKAVIDEYNESTRRAVVMGMALGSNFNYQAAMAENTMRAIEGLVAAGETNLVLLQGLAQQYLEFKRLGEQFDGIIQAQQQGLAGGFEALGARLGQIFGGMTRGFRGFGAVMEQLLGGMLTTLGQVLIAYGVAGIAIKKFIANPAAAIAAGVALVALGSALSSAAQKTLDQGAGGGGGTAAPAANPSGESSSQGSGRLVLELHGDGVIGALFADPRNQDALAQALRDLSGRNVTVVQVMG